MEAEAETPCEKTREVTSMAVDKPAKAEESDVFSDDNPGMADRPDYTARNSGTPAGVVSSLVVPGDSGNTNLVCEPVSMQPVPPKKSAPVATSNPHSTAIGEILMGLSEAWRRSGFNTVKPGVSLSSVDLVYYPFESDQHMLVSSGLHPSTMAGVNMLVEAPRCIYGNMCIGMNQEFGIPVARSANQPKFEGVIWMSSMSPRELVVFLRTGAVPAVLRPCVMCWRYQIQTAVCTMATMEGANALSGVCMTPWRNSTGPGQYKYSCCNHPMDGNGLVAPVAAFRPDMLVISVYNRVTVVVFFPADHPDVDIPFNPVAWLLANHPISKCHPLSGPIGKLSSVVHSIVARGPAAEVSKSALKSMESAALDVLYSTGHSQPWTHVYRAAWALAYWSRFVWLFVFQDNGTRIARLSWRALDEIAISGNVPHKHMHLDSSMQSDWESRTRSKWSDLRRVSSTICCPQNMSNEAMSMLQMRIPFVVGRRGVFQRVKAPCPVQRIIDASWPECNKTAMSGDVFAKRPLMVRYACEYAAHGMLYPTLDNMGVILWALRFATSSVEFTSLFDPGDSAVAWRCILFSVNRGVSLIVASSMPAEREYVANISRDREWYTRCVEKNAHTKKNKMKRKREIDNTSSNWIRSVRPAISARIDGGIVEKFTKAPRGRGELGKGCPWTVPRFLMRISEPVVRVLIQRAFTDNMHKYSADIHSIGDVRSAAFKTAIWWLHTLSITPDGAFSHGPAPYKDGDDPVFEAWIKLRTGIEPIRKTGASKKHRVTEFFCGPEEVERFDACAAIVCTAWGACNEYRPVLLPRSMAARYRAMMAERAGENPSITHDYLHKMTVCLSCWAISSACQRFHGRGWRSTVGTGRSPIGSPPGVVFDASSGAVFCSRDTGRLTPQCATEKSTPQSLVDHVLFFRGWMYTMCSNPACGIQMEVNLCVNIHSPMGYLCMRCSKSYARSVSAEMRTGLRRQNEAGRSAFFMGCDPAKIEYDESSRAIFARPRSARAPGEGTEDRVLSRKTDLLKTKAPKSISRISLSVGKGRRRGVPKKQ